VRPAARQPVTGEEVIITHVSTTTAPVGTQKMNAPASISVTPVRVTDLLAEGERIPVYVYVIDHTSVRVLVDTGMTELHPAAADLDPRVRPLSKQDFDLAGIDIVVNTHLHFDHCGGRDQLAPAAQRRTARSTERARTPLPQFQAYSQPSGDRTLQ